jgi:ribosomal protein S18 acetylase RimI-like enzyme
MRDVSIRRELRDGDAEAIVEQHGCLYRAEYGLSPDMERHVAKAVARALERGWPEAGGGIWIVERDGDFAGSIALTDEGEGGAALRWFLFDPSVRGLGLGNRLVGEVVAEARRQGFERLWLETLGILTTAAAIYDRHGFRMTSERLGPPWGDPDVPYRRYELDLARLPVQSRDEPAGPAGVAVLA